MASSQPSLEELYSKLAIEEEDEGGIVVAKEAVMQNKETYVLAGRFLLEKNINFNAMQTVLSSLWRPKEGVEIHDIGDRRYLFVFYHPLDVQKVLEGGPWSFEQGMLIYKQVSGQEEAKVVLLDDTDIWVQVYDVPRGFNSEVILQSIGNYIGGYIKSDPMNFNGAWKAYVRIRVKMSIVKPLKRRMKIKREDGEWSWINFKYERLGTFCFVCGMVGHSERDCNIVYANPGKEIERAYGTWLRAPGKNSRNITGLRWLRNGEGSSIWGDNGDKSRRPTTGNGDARGEAGFQVPERSVSEIGGDNGRIVVTTRNQGE